MNDVVLFAEPTVAEVVFGAFGVVAVASALLAVASARLVHAALWLVVTLGSIAGCFLTLGAELVAWVQLLVYVGAVVVLVVFALMLTRLPTDAGAAQVTANRPVAAVLALIAAGGLGTTLVVAFAGERIDIDLGNGSAETIGEALFSHWVLGFEIVSVVLLAALVGAVVLSGAVPDRGGSGRDGERS